MKVKKLNGKNIYLGPISKKHIPFLVKWMNDLEVVKYTNQPTKNHTEETAKKYLQKSLESHDMYYFGIFLKDGKFIGGTSFNSFDPINRAAILGITIGEKEYWNKGYGTEAVTLLLDYGFNVLNLNNVMLSVFSANKGGYRCYEKAGFKLIGRRRKARFLAGKYYDEIYMDILAEEFKYSKLKKILK